MVEDLSDRARPLSEEELAGLPVLPLPRVVFFPGSVLPLHLFEPRYRELMESCLRDGPKAMAVTKLADGWEADYEGRPPIHPVAGAGRIVQHRRRPDGRFDLVLSGLHRVRLDELPPEDGRSFRRARAEILKDRTPHQSAVDSLVPRVIATASTVVALVRERYPDFTLGIESDTPPSLLADRIADRLVSKPPARQKLLEVTDVKVRLSLVQDELIELLAALRSEGRGGAVH